MTKHGPVYLGCALLISACGNTSHSDNVVGSPESIGERPNNVATAATHTPTADEFSAQYGGCLRSTVYDLSPTIYRAPANLVPRHEGDGYVLEPSVPGDTILYFSYDQSTGRFLPDGDRTKGTLAIHQCLLPQE